MVAFLIIQLNLERVSEEQVENIIESFKPKESKDIFETDSAMVKDLCLLLKKPTTHIAYLSFSQEHGCFPDHWKPAVLVPIFKNGDPHSAANYRPISILPIMSKVIFGKISSRATNLSS